MGHHGFNPAPIAQIAPDGKLTIAQDVGDLSRMLGWADEATLEQVRQVVARYSPQDAEDLESLIFLGQQERLDPDNRLSP